MFGSQKTFKGRFYRRGLSLWIFIEKRVYRKVQHPEDLHGKQNGRRLIVLEYKHDHRDADDRGNRFNMRYVEMANL